MSESYLQAGHPLFFCFWPCSKADLSTAFSVGKDGIDGFHDFLKQSFSTNSPFGWQVDIFKYWWRIIFSTIEVASLSGRHVKEKEIN